MTATSQKSAVAEVSFVIPDLKPVIAGLKDLAAKLVKMPEIDVIPATLLVLGNRTMAKSVADHVIASIMPKGQTIVAGRVKAMRTAMVLGAAGFAQAEKAATAAKTDETLATTEKVIAGQFARRLADLDPKEREAGIPAIKADLVKSWTFRTASEADQIDLASWLSDGAKLMERNSHLTAKGRDAFKLLIAKARDLK